MKYAILAYESGYCGMHGMYTAKVVEVPNEKDAEFIAIDLANDVIESYYYDAEEEETEDITPEYEIYPIYSEKDSSELDEELCESIGDHCGAFIEEDFLNKYCQKEN